MIYNIKTRADETAYEHAVQVHGARRREQPPIPGRSERGKGGCLQHPSPLFSVTL